jgi:dTDP-glucose 4,6-dehydratase
MRLLVTGGAGFIGSNFVRHAMSRWPDCTVTVLDKLTYAGTRENLRDLEPDERLCFVLGDICDSNLVLNLTRGLDAIINFAAETHVDRSIHSSADFVRTDVEGTRCLLDAARVNKVGRYLQISTDEVYGDMPEGTRAAEDDALRPRSPYAASKAAGDLMVQAYHVTHGIDTVITRCSNNYGPNQFPEKLVSLFVTNALLGQPLPVYGDGLQQRDWIFVEDHCRALALVLEHGVSGEIYNIGTEIERPNIDIINMIVQLAGAPESSIRFVTDRPGHDRRYALDASKVKDLGWKAEVALAEGVARTVAWYRENEGWWRPLRSAEFEDYYARQYDARLAESAI